MLYVEYLAHYSGRSEFPRPLFLSITLLLLLAGFCSTFAVQSYKREMETPEKVSVIVKNRKGRVGVVAAEEQQKKVSIDATSAGLPVEPDDVRAEAKGERVEIDVRSRREQDRIDVVVRIPTRSKVEIESEAGSVDVVGNVELAVVRTNTGTIHADVPLDALKFDFFWEASKPRYMSDVELPEVKEKAGGVFKLSGKRGEKDLKNEDRVALNFRTQRGVILLNIDPAMAPADLRERPLTEAARAIVRSGDSHLVEAIRKV